MTRKKRIVIVGGGFGGVYTAMHLESLRRGDEFEIVLVSSEDYFIFQPLLAEVVSGNIGTLDTINPLHRLLRKTMIWIREVEGIDIANQTVTLRPGFRPRNQVIEYDHLVLSLGTVTDFRNTPGLREHALGFKTLSDAICLRNHLIHVIEEAGHETEPALRKQLLTFVVGGGGFSGVELVAELNDFVRHLAKEKGRIAPEEISVVLVHSGPRVLDREMSESLGMYAQGILEKRGITLRLATRLRTATRDSAVLENGELIGSKTVVATVPSLPNPLVERMDVPKQGGKLLVDRRLQVEGHASLWALGDCAYIPRADGQGAYPPTAQHATREAKVLAANLVATLRQQPLKLFDFPGLGKMGSLGHRRAVVELFGRIRVSGFLAWLMWRTVYWMKLPGLDRKLKLGVSWFLDLVLPPDAVRLKLAHTSDVSRMHFEPQQVIFEQGDLGDAVYFILSGEVEVVRNDQRVATLKSGDFFGEMALLSAGPRRAGIRCLSATDVLVLDDLAFMMLVNNLPDLKQKFERVMATRLASEHPDHGLPMLPLAVDSNSESAPLTVGTT